LQHIQPSENNYSNSTFSFHFMKNYEELSDIIEDIEYDIGMNNPDLRAARWILSQKAVKQANLLEFMARVCIQLIN